MDDITIEIIKNYIIDKQILSKLINDIEIITINNDNDIIFLVYKFNNDDFEYELVMFKDYIEQEK